MHLPDGTVDLESGWVVRPDSRFRLTPTEVAVLRVLQAHAPDPVSKEALLREAWGYKAESRTVVVTMHRLREKLEIDPSQPRFLLTERGAGYRLRPARPMVDDPVLRFAEIRANQGLPPLTEARVAHWVHQCGTWAGALYAAALLAEHTPEPDDLLDAPDEDGATARESILAAFGRLDEPEQSVVAALAVAGQSLESELLVAACALDRRVVLGALQRATSERLVRDGVIVPIVGVAVAAADPTRCEAVRDGLITALAARPSVAHTLAPLRIAIGRCLPHARGPVALALLTRELELRAAYGPLRDLAPFVAGVLADLDEETRANGLGERLFSRVHLDVDAPWEAPPSTLVEAMTDPHRRGAARALLATQDSLDHGGVEDATLELALREVEGGEPTMVLDTRTWVAMVYADQGDPDAIRQFEAVERDAELVDPSRALTALFRRVSIDGDPGAARRLRTRLETHPDRESSQHWCLAASRLAVLLLAAGELAEGAAWLERCLGPLDADHPELAQQARVKAALAYLPDTETALAWLPSLDHGHPVGREITRWILHVAGGSAEPPTHPELVQLAAMYRGQAELVPWPAKSRYGSVWRAVHRVRG